MKKNDCFGWEQEIPILKREQEIPILKKLSMVMRLTIFLLLISMMGVFANKPYSQTLSLNMENAALKEVLFQTENKSGCNFLYNEKFIDVQQQKEVSGKVTDPSEEPLPGVTVVFKGTTRGTITDAAGNYSLKDVPVDAVLVFSFVGMKTQEIPVEGKSSINVVMAEDAIGIEEVVAVGYGTMRKKDLTGSVSSVGGQVLKQIPVTSAADAITGLMPGVQVTRTEGSPDADIKIRIRGGGSITQDNSPLYIVDGFPVENINDIAPSDVKSIDVLKDASSTAIYGARGANGVIIVTTKGGFEGKGKVSYNTYFGMKEISKYYDVLDPYNYVLYQLETLGLGKAQNAFGNIRDFDLYQETAGTNWQKEIFGRTGTNMYHNVSFAGGTKITKYNISLTRNDEKEIMLGSGYSRTNLTTSATHKINDWMTVDFNMRFSDLRLKGMGTSANYSRLSSIVQYRPVEGINSFIDRSLEVYMGDDPLYSIYILNPLDQTNDDYRRKISTTLNFSGSVNIKLSKNLSYQMSGGSYIDKSRDNKFYGLHTYESINQGSRPITRIIINDISSYRLANTLTYNKYNILPGHNLTILAGQELYSYISTSLTDRSTYFPQNIDPVSALNNLQFGTPDPSTTSKSLNNLSSFFGRINYNYKGKYLAAATLRADGSSKFAPGNQWGYFPSVSAGWRISDEGFMKDKSNWLDDLKLRASYGAAGNNRISDNAWQKTFYATTGGLYKEGDEYSETSYFYPYSILSNEKLKWETAITKNIGIDFMLFDQRLTGSIEAYKNTTKDLLIRASIPAQTGYSYQWQNVGQTSNKGIELMLNGILVDKHDLKVSASFNIGLNRNNVDKLGEVKTIEEQTGIFATYGPLNDFIVQEGKPVGQMYGYETDGMYSFEDFNYDYATRTYSLKEGVSDNSVLIKTTYFGPGTLKLKDQNGDLVINEEDRIVLGNANPKHTGGFTLNAQYKGFDFSALFNWVYGNNIYNGNKLRWTSYVGYQSYKNLAADMSNYFRITDPVTGNTVSDPEELAGLNKDASIWSPLYTVAKLHSWIVEDGSFLRLNTVTVGYTLPKTILNKIGINNLRFYVTGYNLWLWTNYSGYDPEVDCIRSTPLTPGVDYHAYPRSRSFNFGLNVEF